MNRRNIMTNKQLKKNPLLAFVSNDTDRLAYEPILKINSSSKPRRVSALEWLKYLESPDKLTDMKKTKQKTKRERKRDLRILDKFWKVAQGRAIARNGFEDPTRTNVNIANEIHEKTGIGLSKWQIILMRRSWDTEIQTHKQRMQVIYGHILDYLAANPDKEPKEVAEALGVPRHQVCHAISLTGTSAREIRKTKNADKKRLRKEFLDSLNIKYGPNERIGSSIAKMIEIISHMREEHGSAVTHYCPVLTTGIEKLDRNIALLESQHVPWDDPDTGLYKLLGDKTETLRKKLALFASVGASSELHYVLISTIIHKTEIYEKEKFRELRTAIIENDYETLMVYTRGIAMHNIKINFWKNNLEYHEVATEAAMSALAECKDRRNNPAAALAIMTVAVEMAVKKKAMEFTTKLGITEKNEDALNHTCFRFLHEPDSSSLLESSP